MCTLHAVCICFRIARQLFLVLSPRSSLPHSISPTFYLSPLWVTATLSPYNIQCTCTYRHMYIQHMHMYMYMFVHYMRVPLLPVSFSPLPIAHPPPSPSSSLLPPPALLLQPKFNRDGVPELVAGWSTGKISDWRSPIQRQFLSSWCRHSAG